MKIGTRLWISARARSFESSLGFLQLLNERISTQNAISLLSINPKALDQKQFMQLKKEFKPLDLPKTPS